MSKKIRKKIEIINTEPKFLQTSKISPTFYNSRNKQVTSVSRRQQTLTEICLYESQKKFPFGINEARFRWQNPSPEYIPVFLETEGKDIRKKIPQVNNDLYGGFGVFYNQTVGNESNKKRSQSVGKRCNTAYYGLKTQRVIQPELDYDKGYTKWDRKQKKAVKGHSQSLSHSSSGSMTFLFDKTPICLPVRCKKKVVINDADYRVEKLVPPKVNTHIKKKRVYL